MAAQHHVFHKKVVATNGVNLFLYAFFMHGPFLSLEKVLHVKITVFLNLKNQLKLVYSIVLKLKRQLQRVFCHFLKLKKHLQRVFGVFLKFFLP